MKTILGIKGWDLSEYAISANAILGIRDSGKTYTATEAAEELFDAGVPFIALDPIGVWHSLRIPGRGKGYPVVVAGGRHGDLPLTIKNAGAIVRAAMEAGVSLVLDLFSMELSKADWRRIVRETVEILLHENVDHGLRHIFIEEAAEFVPQRPQDMLVFSAVEKLVRMGGNSKLGCTLINQRSADLNKSVLELCANVFVHRQTGKNTILDLKKWFEMLALDKAKQTKIADSLPDLKSGQCWAFINDLKAPIRLQVPAKNSQHPDRRAVVAKGAEKRKPVPADAFVAQMTAKLAEKDKPKAAPASQPVGKTIIPDSRAQERAIWEARVDGHAIGHRQGYEVGHRLGFDQGVKQTKAAYREAFEGIGPKPMYMPPATPTKLPTLGKPSPAQTPSATQSEMRPLPSTAAPAPASRKVNSSEANGLTGPQQRMLDTIAFWNTTGDDAPTIEQVAAVCGYSFKASTRRVVAGALATQGFIHYPEPGKMALTATGAAQANEVSAEMAAGKLKSVLTGPQLKIVEILKEHGGQMPRDELIAKAGYSPNASTHRVVIGALSTLRIIHYPVPRVVSLSAWAAEVLADG